MLQKELADCQTRWDNVDVLGGNFNMVLSRNKRSRDHFFGFIASEFKDNLEAFNLSDIPLMGGSWTWSNQWEPPTFSRIDRFLVDPSLLLSLPDLCQKVLPKPISDSFTFFR